MPLSYPRRQLLAPQGRRHQARGLPHKGRKGGELEPWAALSRDGGATAVPRLRSTKIYRGQRRHISKIRRRGGHKTSHRREFLVQTCNLSCNVSQPHKMPLRVNPLAVLRLRVQLSSHPPTRTLEGTRTVITVRYSNVYACVRGGLLDALPHVAWRCEPPGSGHLGVVQATIQLLRYYYMPSIKKLNKRSERTG